MNCKWYFVVSNSVVNYVAATDKQDAQQRLLARGIKDAERSYRIKREFRDMPKAQAGSFIFERVQEHPWL